MTAAERATIDSIIRRFGARKLAQQLGITNTWSIYQWRRNGVPGGRVPEVSRITAIAREKIRPDLYGRPEK